MTKGSFWREVHGNDDLPAIEEEEEEEKKKNEVRSKM